MSRFEIVISYRPRIPIDLISMFVFHCPFVSHFHALHQEIRCRIAMSNEGYKRSADLYCSHRDFQVSDLVMVWLHVRSLGPYKVLNNIGPNIDVLDIPTNLEISPTFYVKTLVPYYSHSIPDPEPSVVTQTFVLQFPQPMLHLPLVTTCRRRLRLHLRIRSFLLDG